MIEYSFTEFMKTKIIVTFTGSFFLAVSLCLGQALKTDSLLAWSDCISIASRNNPDLAAARNSLESSRASYQGSYNGLYPQITLSNSYSGSNASNGSASGSENWQVGGSARLNVFNLSQIYGIKASRTFMTQAETNLRQTSANLRFNLCSAFAQLLFAQKNIEVSQNIVDMRQKEAQLVTLRYNSGTSFKGDMLRANAQFLQAKADLAQSIRDLRTTQRVLNKQLGLDEFTVIHVTSTLNIQEPGDLPQDEQSLVNSRLDVVSEYEKVESAQASLDQSKSVLWPNLSANYSQSSSGASESASFNSFHPSWGLNLSYPLFGGGPTAAYYAISVAKNNLEKEKQNLRSVREQAIVDIETAWSNFMNMIDRSKVQSELLVAARTRYDEANIRYNSGLMSYDNWEIISSDRVSQEHQAVQAQLNALVAEASWAKALGKQLEE